MKDVPFLDYFEDLEDPRVERTKLYTVQEILLTTFAAVICGAEGWTDVELFGESKLDFLKQYFPFENGIPSDDTLRRFFRAINHDSFREMFICWVESLAPCLKGQVIAIDGKTSRRSHDGDKRALHLLSAFATEARLVLGQVKTHEKSNEIRAIPELLELLDIQGATISIDAMGCQKHIADKIIKKEADYILALKGNQTNLHKDIAAFFDDIQLLEGCARHEDYDKGHGRIETRTCHATDDIDWLMENHDWPGLRSIIRIHNKVEEGEKTSQETRYYISSLPPDPEHLLPAIRSHWAIENSLHWVMDMTFNDDQSRIRKGNAPENMAIIKHVALNLIKKTQTKRQSIKVIRKKAGWDNRALQNILNQKFR
jgi:predicted transposase YbfD/YdcC